MTPPNSLINEKSPYLLQHAYNPVDWHPWGEAAFKKARDENKPILLSVGYSTCHWCHVMEKESFSDPQIAQVMNENLVCIKLDREERPDVDKIYMTAVQAMTGQGGWPLNVFLTPDLKPFYGGTYFPPEERWGRIGWPDLVRQVGLTWRSPEEHKKIVSSAEHLTQEISQFLNARSQPGDLNFSILENGFNYFKSDYDPVLGGFGGAPKFPMPVNHHFLLRYHAAVKAANPKQAAESLEMSLETLRAMARGGIYDHLGGGFSRYSTDERWHVPHFEKMLYDNSQLIQNYLEAFQVSGDPLFSEIARESLDYILRDMTDAKGGFYSAEDADSLPPELAGEKSGEGHEHKSEGAFYIWTKKEILRLLGNPNGEIFSYRYGVLDHGNAESDPQGEFNDKNILFAAKTPEQTAQHFEMPLEEIEKILGNSRRRLFEERRRRPRPHLDDKIIASWNGLMISALCRAWQTLGETKYIDAAVAAAEFISQNLFDSGDGRLYRRWREKDRKVAGLADDYACIAQACLDLYESNFDPKWFRLGLRLMEELRLRFFDPENPGLFMTEKGSSDDLLLRAKDDQDNVEPSAGSVACLNALRLAEMLGDPSWKSWAETLLKSFAGPMRKNPRAFPQMMSALSLFLSEPRQILLVGKPEATRPFLDECRRRFLPNRVIISVDDRWAVPREFSWVYDIVKSEKSQNVPAMAYVCKGRACDLPVTDLREFQKRLMV